MTSTDLPVSQELVSEIALHIDPIGWIRITWDTPVPKDHADAALLAATSPTDRAGYVAGIEAATKDS